MSTLERNKELNGGRRIKHVDDVEAQWMLSAGQETPT
jgi:hypothetical protein